MNYVLYIRRSTTKQNLSFEAQMEVLSTYVNQRTGMVLATFEESESGKNDDRPKLAEAIAYAKRTKSTLLVKSICRLGRSLAKICSILDDDINLEIADIPNGSPKVMLQMMGVMVTWEGQMISTRTKDALAALKRAGKKLGNPNIQKISSLGLASRRKAGMEFKSRIRPIALRLSSEGMGATQIAAHLNSLGILTIRKQPWTRVSVGYLMNN